RPSTPRLAPAFTVAVTSNNGGSVSGIGATSNRIAPVAPAFTPTWALSPPFLSPAFTLPMRPFSVTATFPPHAPPAVTPPFVRLLPGRSPGCARRPSSPATPPPLPVCELSEPDFVLPSASVRLPLPLWVTDRTAPPPIVPDTVVSRLPVAALPSAWVVERL